MFAFLGKGDVFVVIISDYELRSNRILSPEAVDLFYKINHIVIGNNVEYSLEITLDQIVKMLGCSRSIALKYKNELVDNGFMEQNRLIPNRCIYTLKVFSYDILAGTILKNTCNSDLVYMLAEESKEQFPELFWLVSYMRSEETGYSEDSHEEQSVPVLVGAMYNAESQGKIRLPKPVRNTGHVTQTTHEDNPKVRLTRHPFVDFKKPVDKWTSKDFVDYYDTNYNQKYGGHAPKSKIALPTMAREYNRIGKEALKEQIRVFFMLCESNRYAPTWETFASANVQQKLDHYRKTGEVVGFGGKIQDKNLTEIRAEKKKEENDGSYDEVNSIGDMLFMYEFNGKEIFEDPAIGEDYRRILDLATEKGLELHKRYGRKTDLLIRVLTEMGRMASDEKTI